MARKKEEVKVVTTPTKLSDITNDWYVENRERRKNEETGEYYYTLNQLSLLTLKELYNKEFGLITWTTELVKLNESIAVVKVNLLVNGNQSIEWIGAYSNDYTLSLKESALLDIAQNKALHGALRKLILEANLPTELTIVEIDQHIVADPLELDLPSLEEGADVNEEVVEEKPARKTRKKKIQEEKVGVVEEANEISEAKESVEGVKEVEEIVNPEVELSEQALVSEKEESDDTSAKDNALEEAFNFHIENEIAKFKGKTLKEVYESAGGPSLIVYYAKNADNSRFAQMADLCEAAKVITDALGLQGNTIKQ